MISRKIILCQVLLVGLIFWSFTLNNQPSVLARKNYYTNKAKQYLIKHDELWNYIDINEEGINIFANPSDKKNNIPEYKLFWDEIETFNNIVKNFRYEDAFASYKTKKTKKFDPLIVVNSASPPKPLSRTNLEFPLAGKKIALDPGHVGNDIHMGIVESRFVQMNIEEEKIEFNEGELTYATAYLLKEQLEAKGAEVLITRSGCNNSALGKSFQEWYKKDMEKDLVEAVHEGRITKEFAYWLKNEASEAKVFQKYFQNLDWKGRSKIINDFRPDLTIIIHYNADEDNKGWSKPSDKNYNVAFIGGGYVKDELLKIEDRFQFLRQLVTNDLENSMNFSGTVIKSFEECLKVPAIAKNEETCSIKNFSMPTSYKGVYSRNLALTRYVMGTVCYGESLLQDNIKECRELNKRDFEYTCGKTSSRVKDVSEAYYKGIIAYFKSQTL